MNPELQKQKSVPDHVTVQADSAGAVAGELHRLEPVQQAGLWLAAGVGIVIFLVISIIVVDWSIRSPWLTVPAGLAEMDEKKAKTIIDGLKTLNDIAADRSVRMFDTVVARSLLPVFTAILGYIFGTRAGSRNTAD